MSQHSMTTPVVGTVSGVALSENINAIAAALVSNNSGPEEPTATFPHMWWADTTAGVLKRRNAADSGWISVISLTGEAFAKDGSDILTGDLQLATGKGIIFEGTTGDTFETTLLAGEPDVDRAIALPNKSGTLAMIDDISDIKQISVVMAANAATLTLAPTTLDFRSNTLTSGVVNRRSISSAINTVISSGSTAGTVNAIASRIILLAIDNSGTVELAWTNSSGGLNLDETTLISTAAEGGAGAADSASIIYSTTARTNVPFRVVGYFDSTQAIAGTWATDPSVIQGSGGQALAALSSLGYGQSMQQPMRALGTTYYNTTSKPIFVTVCANAASPSQIFYLTINGDTKSIGITSGTRGMVSFIAQPGSYSLALPGASVEFWTEWR